MVSYPNQVSGPETISGSSSTGLLSINNTTTVTGATNGDLEFVENASTSNAFGIMVNGDTNNRLVVTGAGAHSWGPGNGATDTTLSRTGVGTLTATGLAVTNNQTVGGTLMVTGLITPSSGVNLTGISTPGTPGTSNVIYADSLFRPSSVNPSGLVQTLSGTIQATTSTTTVASTASITSLQAFTVPANDVAAGTIYQMTGYGVYSDTGTPTIIFTLLWGGTGGTTVIALPAITLPLNITNSPFSYVATVNFRSTTSVMANVVLNIDTSIATDLCSTYVASPTSPVTVTTTGANALTMAVTWSASSSSNTISLNGGMIQRIA